MSDDWLTEDPFADPQDPAAREREERRREREERRQKRAAKKGEAPPPQAAEPPPAATPPAPKRSPEQEFWDEDPTPEPTPAAPAAAAATAADPVADDPAPRKRRGLLRRRDPEPEPPAPAEPAAAKPAPAEKGEAARPAAAAKPAATEKPTPSAAQTPSPVAIPDPEAPPRGEHAVPAGVSGSHAAPDPNQPEHGQTSEEWAAVPAAAAVGADPDWADFQELHEEGHPEMAGAAREGRRHGDDGGRRDGFLGALGRHPFRIATLILAVIVLWFLNALFQPFHGDGSGHVAVNIPKGASVSEVGDILEKRGVIDDGTLFVDGSTLFQVRATIDGKRSDLFAGHFTLQHGMSYGAAIDALSKEPSAAKPGIKTITLPEGYTRGQAAQIVSEDGVSGNYKKATVKSKFLSPAEYGGKGAKSLEGFLFPDTFELKPKAPVKDLVQLQLQDFKRKIKKVDMKYANSKNLTIFDVVTIASMIEREAGVPKQRKLVASVIYNRLHEGIPLGIDATIRFATGNFEKPLTESELATESPYNTRTNQGLPPGPINSPGLASIEAAAHPAKTDYLYYVNDPNSCNELTFAKNEAEFEAAVQKYEQAREANGGNAPSTCSE